MWQIKLDDVDKIYNPGLFKKKVFAVKSLDLAIEQGEVFGLVGPNGAGKSTTIRMILGMIRPTKGRIHFSERFSNETDFRQKIGYLPENPYLYDHLSLRELLAFCGRVSGMPSDRILSRGNLLIEKLGLVNDSKRPLRTFSKGMLQRAGFCFALLHDPPLVILDEPMSGLDPVGRKMIFDLILQLKKEGKTVFFCSHILSDVERLCDRIGIMVRGKMSNILDKNRFINMTDSRLQIILPRLEGNTRSRFSFYLQEQWSTQKQDVLLVDPADLSRIYEDLKTSGIDSITVEKQNFRLEQIFLQAVEDANNV